MRQRCASLALSSLVIVTLSLSSFSFAAWLVLTAVISNSGSALKAGMWASRPQPLRILAPMMPTRIFSVAMIIFPYAA